jgi:hypothetical protein
MSHERLEPVDPGARTVPNVTWTRSSSIGTLIGMITEPFSLSLYLVGATALGQGYIQVIMPMHVAR